jgi:hypothetical protein
MTAFAAAKPSNIPFAETLAAMRAADDHDWLISDALIADMGPAVTTGRHDASYAVPGASPCDVRC